MATVSSTSSTTPTTTASQAAATALTASTSTTNTSTTSIDWSGLIEASVQARLVKADNIDVKVTTNDTKIAAYQSLQTLMNSVQTAAQALRAPSGTSLASTDVFNSRTAYLTANGNVDPSAALSATVASGAEIGSFALTISQLAKTHKVAGTVSNDKTTDLGYAGVISLGTQSGTATDITITATMSLAEVAEAIDNYSTTTGVQASVLQISDTQFELVMSTTTTGQTITASKVSGDDVLNDLGITDAAGAFTTVLQESSQAIFTVDGIAITRSTNDVDDVVSGVTLHLYEATPAGSSITVEVGTDLSAVKDAIVALADSYNAFRQFAYTQQQIPSDTTSQDSILFSDGTLRSIGTSVGSALTTTIGPLSMSLLGLSFDEFNNLVLDESVLDDALLTNLDDIKTLLSFDMTSSSADVLLLNRGTQTPADFSLDVTLDSTGALSGASVGGDSSLFTVSGSVINGAAGTVYEGYSFVFVGSASTSIDLSFSTGLAEVLYNVAETAADATYGTLAGLVTNLDTQNTDLQAKSDDIRAQAQTYRTNLTDRYAKLQAAIATAESSQTYLTQLLATWNNPA
jgi:flagellar hook-associated protein 2